MIYLRNFVLKLSLRITKNIAVRSQMLTISGPFDILRESRTVVRSIDAKFQLKLAPFIVPTCADNDTTFQT